MINSIPGLEREKILAVLDQEAAAIGAGDTGAYLATLTDDAVFMPPNLPAKTGAELRKWLGDFLQGVTVQWLDMARLETVVVGDLAYHVFACSWKVSTKSQGDPRVLHFKGLHILRRQVDGAWKIAREIWNTNPETSAAS